MANHACIAIGINRYQFLPALNYGEADAQALWQFLVNQTDLPSNQCLRLTDTSPLVDVRSSYPTRENIWRAIDSDRQTSWDSGSWRWFFFSGYGVSWEQADYLLPIDADPKDIPGTAISARSLLTALKRQGNENLLVLLDINRSPGLQAGAPVGAQLVELARELGIVLVLSSQIDQFSHEAAALGHGLFTRALLEALTYYHTDITLETLERYLRDRLPELSQHHWRPIQTPLMVIPSHINKQQLIFPTAVYSGEHEPVGASSAFIPRTSIEAEDIYEENFYNGGTGLRPQTTVSVLEPTDTVFTTPPATPNHVTSIPVAMVPYTSTSESTVNGWRWWQPLLLWGGAVLVLALMIAAVVLRNRDALTNPQAIETTPPNVSPNTSPLVNTPPSSQTVPQNTAQPTTASPQTSLQSRLQANQETLERAKRLLRHNHASLFNKAIVEARQVKSGDPLYQQARQDITRWSGVILDLAEGRAKEGNFGGAIVAAQLVPKDDPSVYATAQQAINQWTLLAKQQQQNKAIIQAAKAQLQPNQASSYSRAITTLRQVLPNQPRYAEAQQLTAQWSRTIYLIAQSRAARGRLKEAIQTAALVPAGTPSSDAAKAAIAKWQQGKR
ncbi:MAG: hypothetical protein Fur006_56860 [Coleofasciculaceae cyanobacterium]